MTNCSNVFLSIVVQYPKDGFPKNWTGHVQFEMVLLFNDGMIVGYFNSFTTIPSLTAIMN